MKSSICCRTAWSSALPVVVINNTSTQLQNTIITPMSAGSPNSFCFYVFYIGLYIGFIYTRKCRWSYKMYTCIYNISLYTIICTCRPLLSWTFDSLRTVLVNLCNQDWRLSNTVTAKHVNQRYLPIQLHVNHYLLWSSVTLYCKLNWFYVTWLYTNKLVTMTTTIMI